MSFGCFGCGSSVTASSASTAASATVRTAKSKPVKRVSDFGSNWTTYHGNAEATGVPAAPTTLRPVRRAWTSPNLDGQLYGEPLVADGRVIAATENDTVYVMAARSGRILWSRHLARPVPSGDLPCGDISPEVGITGTPVIDLKRSEIFCRHPNQGPVCLSWRGGFAPSIWAQSVHRQG